MKTRTDAARTAPLCLWSIQEKDEKPLWNVGLQCPAPGTPGLGTIGLQCPFVGTPDLGSTTDRPTVSSCGNTRPRQHDASLNPRFLALWPLRFMT